MTKEVKNSTKKVHLSKEQVANKILSISDKIKTEY
jgi:hypothetical protein